MMRVAWLCSADVFPGAAGRREDAFEVDHQLDEFGPACASVGIELIPAVWDAELPPDLDAVVVGPTWDYTDRPDAFLARLDAIHAETPIWNSPDLIRWNLDKRYLRELAERGIPTLPTVWADAATDDAIAEAAARFGTEQLVVKPVVGAGALQQVRLPAQQHAPRPPGPVLIQAFQPSIQEYGELSVVCFGGTPSHAVRKRPKKGDYRVQSLYGGFEEVALVTPAVDALVRRALDALPGPTLYARVDLVLDGLGDWAVIELELIEPYLYPEQGPGSGRIFAESLRGAIGAHGLAG